MSDVVEEILGGVSDVREPKPSRLALVPFYKIEVGTCGAYLVKGLIPREGLIVVWGPPKCGKSFWTFDLVMHVVLGREYRGRRVQQGPVVYVACEGAHGFKARIAAYRQEHLNGELPPFYLVPTRLDLVSEHAELSREITRSLGNTHPAAIVLDTLNRSLEGSESSDADMGAYVKAADVLRETFGCAVIVVHHCGIEGSRPRGHTSLTGAADAQLAVKRNIDGLVTVTLEWMKDGPDGDQIHSRLEAVEVGTDDDGDLITSCVVVPVAQTTEDTKKPLTGNAKTAYEALIAVVDKRQILSESDHQAGHSTDVPVDVWRDEFTARQIDGRDTKRDTLKKRFQRAAKTLQSLGRVGFRDGKAWINRTAGHSGT